MGTINSRQQRRQSVWRQSIILCQRLSIIQKPARDWSSPDRRPIGTWLRLASDFGRFYRDDGEVTTLIREVVVKNRCQLCRKLVCENMRLSERENCRS